MAAETTTSRSDLGRAVPVSRGGVRASRGSPRRIVVGALGLCLALPLGCKKSEPKPALLLPPAAPERPQSVVAELTVPRPTESWAAAGTFAGPIARALPRAPELALGAWLGLPPLSATRLELKAPLVAAVVALPERALVVGVRTTSGAEVIADLTTGAAASRRLDTLDSKTGLRLLVALEPGQPLMAVLDNVVLFGERAALLAAGPYVARALSPRAKETGPVSLSIPGAALRERLLPWLRAAWEEKRNELARARSEEEQSQGRPPDFADPDVMLAAADRGFAELLNALSGAERLTAELTFADDRLDVRSMIWSAPALVPAGAESETNAVLPDLLAALPATSALALLFARGSRSSAPQGAPATLSALFADRLSASDERAFSTALSELDTGLGNAQALALLADKGLLWRGEVADATALRRGLTDALGLVNLEPVAAPLGALLGRPRLKQRGVKPGASRAVERASITLTPRTKASGAPAVRNVEVSSLVEPGRFLVALRLGAEPALEQILAAEAGSGSLGAQPASQSLVRALEPSKLAFYVDFERLGLSPGAAPLLVNWRQLAGHSELAVRASAASVRALVALEQNQ